ncbi:MAG: carbohydrate-binding domain-containing protein [Treponema sp.]|nr:carbohydrate-binding domain-containing protein [Candidatus Treponema caballi]
MKRATARFIFACSFFFSFCCFSVSASQRDIISNPDDVYASVLFGSEVCINLNDCTITYGGNASAGTVSLTRDSDNLLFESAVADELKITLTGSLNGTFTVNTTKGGYAIVLDNAYITAQDGPALNLLSKNRAFVVCETGTENVLTDSVVRTANTKKGALYAKGALVLSSPAGKIPGKLTVNAGYKHGIYSDDYIRVTGGDFTVHNSGRDCIRSVNGFIMDSGIIVMNGTGSNIDEESKGIKVDGEENEKHPGEGFIIINGGCITSTTVSKGISAGWKIAEDAETETTDDDPNPYLTINGGSLNITTTGKPYEYTTSDGTTVNNSPEGIEAKNDLTINGGIIMIRTADDCINAGKAVIINGGVIDVISTENDAIDANGTLTFNGGSITATGGRDPECAFDCDFNTFLINGGTVVGTGGSNYTSPASSSKQHVIIWNVTASKGDVITVEDSTGLCILKHTCKADSSTMVLSSPLFTSGSSYTVKCGTEETAVTISSAVTVLGNARGMFGGPQMNGDIGRPPEPPEGFDPSRMGDMPPDGFGGGKGMRR